MDAVEEDFTPEERALLLPWARAAQQVVRNITIPIRDASYNAAPFWSIPLTITRARPLPVVAAAPGAWVDFLTIPVRADHKRVIYAYVAQPFGEGAVEFRWVRRGKLYAPDTLNLNPVIDRHIDRNEAHPYPCTFRPVFLVAGSDDEFKIQARGLVVGEPLAFVVVYGWYYPALRSGDEVGMNEGVDDNGR